MTTTMDSEQATGPTRRLLVFLGLVTLARLAFAALIPLTDDEAYYRLWAQNLDYGYFDHPPMVAWWIGAGVSLLGDNALGVRFCAVLASGLTGLLLFDLARQQGLARVTAERAAIWYHCTLMVAGGGLLAMPDAAATLFWVICLWSLSHLFVPQGRARPGLWWCAAGAAAGLAVLSKYSSLFIAPGVLLWVLWSPERRRALATPWPWVAGLVAAALFGVNVWWNAENGWLTFVKQFGRVEPSRFQPRYLIELLLTQMLLLNPFITGFALRGLRLKAAPSQAVAPERTVDLSLVVLTGLPFMAYLVLHALHDRVQGHWPTPLYPALAVAAAVAASRPAASAFGAFARRAVPIFGLGLAAIVLMFGATTDHRRGFKGDPARAIRQWPAFAGTVQSLGQAQGVGWIGTLSYVTLAQLANQSELALPVLQLTERDRYAKAGPPKGLDTTRPGLVIDLARRLNADDLAQCFATVQRLPDIRRGGDGPGAMVYGVFRVTGPRMDLADKGCWSAKTLADSQRLAAGKASK